MLLPLFSLFPLLSRALLFLDPFQEEVQLYDFLGQLKDFFVKVMRDALCQSDQEMREETLEVPARTSLHLG
jgi:hypothetical protein